MDFISDITLQKSDYKATSTGNIIHNSTNITNTSKLEIPQGKCFINKNAKLNTDQASIRLNKYVYIDENADISTSTIIKDNKERDLPLLINSYSFIGKNSKINCISIGMGCKIEDNVILKNGVILKDYVHVLKDSVVLDYTIIPPFSIVSGNPARIIGELPESQPVVAKTEAQSLYSSIKLI